MEKSSKKKRGKKEFLAQKLADYKKQKKISFRAKNGGIIKNNKLSYRAKNRKKKKIVKFKGQKWKNWKY